MEERKSQNWIGIVILVISLLLVINDFIIAPLRSRNYLRACYESSFFLANTDEPLYLREQFYKCLEQDLNEVNLRSCWVQYAPNTYDEYIEIAANCPTGLYDSQKILFNK
jgi:hypothetical protein